MKNLQLRYNFLKRNAHAIGTIGLSNEQAMGSYELCEIFTQII